MRKYKKGQIYILMEGLLNCFPDKIGECLIDVLNAHKISKDLVMRIFQKEVREGRSRYRIIAGALILLNDQLKNGTRNFYYAMKVVPELKYCFYNDTRKTVKKWSAECILRLFLSLYYEFILLPLPLTGAKNCLSKFKDIITKEDIDKIVEELGIFKEGDLLTGRFIFECYGIEFDITNPGKTKRDFNKILRNFYAPRYH